MIVGDVVRKKLVKMPMAEDDNVLKHLSTYGSYPSFGDSILPGTFS